MRWRGRPIGRRLVCLTLPAAALVLFCSSAASSVWYGWKWPQPATGPVRLRVVTDNEFPRELAKPLRAAIAGWNKSGVFRLDLGKPVQACDPMQELTICVSAVSNPVQCPGAGGCAWTDAIDQPSDPWLAHTGRVWINTDYLNAGPVWQQHVACHELGHTLGLGHSEDGPTPFQPSCMSNNNNTPTPSQDDLNLLRSLYTVRG